MKTIVSVLLCGIWLVPRGAAADDMRIVSEAAQTRTLPPAAPRYSDVCFSIRWLRKTIDPLETIRAWHGTRFDWVQHAYAEEKVAFLRDDLIREAKSAGYVVGQAIAPSRQDWGKPESVPESYTVGRTQDLNGKPLRPRHQVWSPVWGCPSSPAFLELLAAHVKFGIDTGADYVQVDGPDLSQILKWGGHPDDPETPGCFCDDCQANFRAYLSDHFTAAELNAMGVADVATFSYRDHLVSGNRHEPLRDAYEACFRASCLAFWPQLRERADQEAGRRYPFSCNNGSYTKWEEIQQIFDFALGELSSYDPPNPASLKKKMERVIALGKAQAFTLRSTDPEYNRRVLSLSYCLGANYIMPWDVWIQGVGRFFGEPEDYHDLSAFVRANAAWLDGYEYAAAVGPDVRDAWYGEAPPVAMDGNPNAYAFIRARPGRAKAPVVVHLLDWGVEKQPFILKVDPRRFFREDETEFTLLVPAQQSPAEHENVKQTGDFSSFVLSEVLPGDRREGRVWLRVPKLNPWGIVLVSRKG